MTMLGDVLVGSAMVGIGAGQVAAEHDAFGGATLTVAGLLALLGAQEVDKAAAWRVADIAAMRALLADAGREIPETGSDLTLTALDADWAVLSDALIALHADVEDAGDRAADAAICAFYRDSAARRMLDWPM